MDNVTQQIQNAASTMLRACRETGNCQISLVLRDKDEKPVAGVFCVNSAELTEIIENAVTLYEERQIMRHYMRTFNPSWRQ
jgi:Ethanolamine utilization protein EutJ (predicted chaperonin)